LFHRNTYTLWSEMLEANSKVPDSLNRTLLISLHLGVSEAL